MKSLRAFWQRLSPIRVLAIALMGILLMTTTACNRGDLLGARPNNPPVQMGGQNNPHKQGGDGYTQYKVTESPVVNDRS